MLDKNALSQLQSLKQEIQKSIPRYIGTVRASAGRYGFVATEDGQSFYLSPDEMEKILPGDRIDFRVETNAEGKEQAFIEALLHTEAVEFHGTYLVRGKGHFVDSDHPNINRWIFVPPSQRMNAQDGDFVHAHISQHPYPHGKAQASINAVIGHANEPFIETRFTKAKWGLSSEFSPEALAEIEQLKQLDFNHHLADRTDLTHLPFVTIDSAGTRDLDDALYAEAQSQGWTLWIAIADPSAFVEAQSALDNEARLRATSVYFPDQVVPMLPPELSDQLCSLQPNQLRPALVVELRITENGDTEHIHIHNAQISSHAKLSYNQVAQFIEGDPHHDVPAELHGHLVHLDNCARALNAYRKQHCLTMDDRPDFKLVLDEQGKVKDIVRIERNQAHRIVEECMLACNKAIAHWIAERNTGIFVEHAGVRTERKGEVAALLKEHLPLESKPSLDSLHDYVQLMQQAEASNSELPLRMIINRLQERSNLSLQAKPHMGLGFECYTTFTSPLRKYNDLILHRLVRAAITEQPATLPSESDLQAIQQAQLNARMAANQVDVWLKLQWLALQDSAQHYDATIVHMNAMSFTVRLDSTGIEGNIDRRKANGWTFDSKTLTHRKDDQVFLLGQAVRVKVQELQPQTRTVKFALV